MVPRSSFVKQQHESSHYLRTTELNRVSMSNAVSLIRLGQQGPLNTTISYTHNPKSYATLSYKCHSLSSESTPSLIRSPTIICPRRTFSKPSSRLKAHVLPYSSAPSLLSSSSTILPRRTFSKSSSRSKAHVLPYSCSLSPPSSRGASCPLRTFSEPPSRPKADVLPDSSTPTAHRVYDGARNLTITPAPSRTA